MNVEEINEKLEKSFEEYKMNLKNRAYCLREALVLGKIPL